MKNNRDSVDSLRGSSFLSRSSNVVLSSESTPRSNMILSHQIADPTDCARNVLRISEIDNELRMIEEDLRLTDLHRDTDQLGVMATFFQHVVDKKNQENRGAKLEWKNFLRELVKSDEVPTLRLVRGSTLALLGRFPRSSETEHIVVVDNTNIDEILSAAIYFVSHRWACTSSGSSGASSDEEQDFCLDANVDGGPSPQADTADNSQAKLLIAWLNREHVLSQGWERLFFWIDWGCIDQDDDEMKARQMIALPIYLRCCTYFVGIAWGEYWRRCWCGLEVIAFDTTKKRTIISKDGSTEVLNNRVEAKQRLAVERDDGRSHVWEGDCFNDGDRSHGH